MQTTLATTVRFDGVGLHSGRAVVMEIHPAGADTGVVFERVDLDGRMVPARWDVVTPSKLCTLVEAGGVSVSTIEHVMAALAGTGVHNARITLDGPEVPILDGSSEPFVSAIIAAGLVALGAPLRALKLLKAVEVVEGEAVARIEPARGFEMEFHIDFADAAIGRQDKAMSLANGAFVRELMDSRTFCRASDVELMRANGLALGGTYENAVVVDGDKVLSPGGLRHADEAVRHKMLDALGDLALAGGPILGRYTGNRAGHAMTNKLLRAVFADDTAYEWVALSPREAYATAGAGVCAIIAPERMRASA